MYWYISFLRPPPISAQVGGSITITPQVANDLRTDLRYEATDIAYAWQRVYPTEGRSDRSLAVEHLTTFLPPSSTYRSLSIPLPETAKPGERWRLGLFPDIVSESSTSASRAQVALARNLLEYSAEGPSVLSVWSEGIEITRPQPAVLGPVRGVGSDPKANASANANAKGKKAVKDDGKSKPKGKGKEKDEGPKQGRILREWSLDNGGMMRIVEQTSFDLDKKIWDSGLALSSWLWRHLRGDGASSMHHATKHDPLTEKVLRVLRHHQGPLRLLELGSGTGLVSIGLARALRGLTENVHTTITATDLDSAIGLMVENFALNDLAEDAPEAEGLSPSPSPSSSSSGDGVAVRARVLDWEQPLPSWVSHEADQSIWPDLIIAADVTYNTASFPALLGTLSALLDPPALPRGRERPMLLLAYKQRDPGERGLWSMLERKGIKLRQVDEVRGAEEDGRVEIWVGGRDVI